LGSDLVSVHKSSEAIQILSSVIKTSPDRTDAYMPLARAYRMAGQQVLAAATARKLIEKNPGDPMLQIMLVLSLLEDGQSRQSEALEELAEAERVTPTDPDIYSLRGQIYFSRGEYQGSIGVLLRAIELRPVASVYHYQLALAYRRLGKEDEANQEIETKNHLEQAQVLRKTN
jgi:Flp pilus assembly protein TadD